MIIENRYLLRAVEKAGYIIIVKKYNIKEKNSKLEYISPNASGYGINVDFLIKGIKLTEDYIYPADRLKVDEMIWNAHEQGISEYIHEYRMVGDDGVIRNITNEITLSEGIMPDTFNAEFYIRENTQAEAKKKSRPPEESKENTDNFLFPESKRMNTLIQLFSELAGLYSVIVDSDRKVLYEPVGPATNLGDFYDLFEKPNYKEYFDQIKQKIDQEGTPFCVDREEGGTGKISVAPIKFMDEIKAYWIVGSYTAEESEKLSELCEFHWYVADTVSAYIYNKSVAQVESAKAKGAGVRLREEMAKQGVIEAAIARITCKDDSTLEQKLEEMFKEAGTFMSLDNVFMFRNSNEDSNSHELFAHWDSNGAIPDEEVACNVSEHLLFIEKELVGGDEVFCADVSNLTENTKIALMRYNYKSLIVRPIFVGGKLYGSLFFVEKKNDRVWTGNEIKFTKTVADVAQIMLEKEISAEKVANINRQVIDTYNYFNIGIFVRDAYTGEVLFSNTKMNEMLGEDFVGGDSRKIVTDLRDKFDNISGMRKPFITKEKVAKWRSYIQCMDDIMDITEIQINWLDGQPASLIILRKAKDL